MSQQSVPISDLAVTGSGFPNQWLNAHTATPVALYSAIDEGLDNDTQAANDDVILPTTAAAGDHIFVVKLSSVLEPGAKFGWRIEWMQKWLNGGAGEGTTKTEVELRQGYVDESNKGMLIDTSETFGSIGLQTAAIHKEVWVVVEDARDSHGGLGPPCLGTHAITNYSDLSLRYTARIPAGQTAPDGVYISSAQVIFAQPPEAFLHPRQFPQSPIYGDIVTNGSINGSGVCQIINPTTSPYKLNINELWIWGGGADSANSGGRQRLNAARVTDNPWSPGAGATTVFANIVKLDPSNAQTVWAIIKAFNFWNAQYHGPLAPAGNGWFELEENGVIKCPWMLRPEPGNTNQPTWIRRPLSFPLCLMPGQTFETCWMDTGTGNSTRLGCVFDQVLLP